MPTASKSLVSALLDDASPDPARAFIHKMAKVGLSAENDAKLAKASRELVSDFFIEKLRDFIPSADYLEMQHEALGEGIRGTCCAHDYCDANEAMDDAILKAVGFTATSTGNDEVGCMTDAAMDLFEQAFTVARKRKFLLCNDLVRVANLAGGPETHSMWSLRLKFTGGTFEGQRGEELTTVYPARAWLVMLGKDRTPENGFGWPPGTWKKRKRNAR